MARILLVEDEANARQVLILNLMSGGHMATGCPGPDEAKKLLKAQDFDVVITDLNMDGNPRAGIDVVRMVTEKGTRTNTILLTAYASADTAVEAMREGAFDYLTKPVSSDEINAAVERALLAISGEVAPNNSRGGQVSGKSQSTKDGTNILLTGQSNVMQRVKDRLKRAASHEFTVLISGESGTGKELAARFVHAHSEQHKGPFVPVHCGAIPEGLFESELFGHCKGAFTSADSQRVGLIESAADGTLFLDEVGEMPLSIQVKLLRVLQEKSFRRVGENTEHPSRCRIVAATNRDLQEDVRKGLFREDLFYRLNVVPVHIPPLRSRREDIAELVQILVRRVNSDIVISPECMIKLEQLPLVGNVRELENVLQRMIALSDGYSLDATVLDEFYHGTQQQLAMSLQDLQKSQMSLDQALEAMERQMVCEAMEEAGDNATQAAKLLGISFRSLRYRLQKFDMKADSNDE
ncbi:MAG: DNA-binding response regulator [Zetaproteobacteria bacterium CG_4_9_14_3_um_filter_49_83]|nr:MAG: DNA-binding response regulator [Zetaproteobacteria bacterium CG1_02_49_23]PIQ30055.1 MAG: DNA-binding response regulator [Zetaproteobacteria bacterium CG17_big_fil_post_rev_8_21_14_2_50_50_13]PIV29203.1 MAG: DNA-binding response regulator [Zetaproteobacteria bacterium CG02_land_8_20_14_3_00_50_9]PIY55997.1 MAG: DNA-binding response regulator [Zetaproteobacteria bacterium CG_4_10_14_0_8_um_filter_49_80]PJA36327.1 MAG: DNA-binding response regulator [Zetaproteobacteria bacterium CG_4_9_14